MADMYIDVYDTQCSSSRMDFQVKRIAQWYLPPPPPAPEYVLVLHSKNSDTSKKISVEPKASVTEESGQQNKTKQKKRRKG